MPPSRSLAWVILPESAYYKAEALSKPSTRVRLGVCRSDDNDESDPRLLRRMHDIVKNIAEDAQWLDAYTRLPFNWVETEYYDVVNPFGDSRGVRFWSLWIFDIDKDMLSYINEDQRSFMEISQFRHGAPDLANFEPLPDAEYSPKFNPSPPERMCWKPKIILDERIRAFAHRIVRDMMFQWRHVLRNDFNAVTLRAFGRAMILLATFQFEISEEAGFRNNGERGSYVYVLELPAWEPFHSNVVHIKGGFHLVLCECLQDGLSTAQKHSTDRNSSKDEDEGTSDGPWEQKAYLLLSNKYIMLSRVTSEGELEHTAPEVFFEKAKGELTSDLALDYLLWATAASRPKIASRIQKLPLELQDNILSYVSAGTVASARIGCILGAGSVFSWKDGSLPVNVEDYKRNRGFGAPVESKLWFGTHMTGLVYKPTIDDPRRQMFYLGDLQSNRTLLHASS